MKTLRWNIGILFIRIGYNIRGRNGKETLDKSVIRWRIGKFILGCGYNFRDQIPQRTWKWNHI